MMVAGATVAFRQRPQSDPPVSLAVPGDRRVSARFRRPLQSVLGFTLRGLMRTVNYTNGLAG